LKVRVSVVTPFSSVRLISELSLVIDIVAVFVLLVAFMLLMFALALVVFVLSLPAQAVNAVSASAHEPINKILRTS
jgi:hypothetical protein